MTLKIKKIIIREGLILFGVVLIATITFFIISLVKVHPRWSYGEWWWRGVILFFKWLYIPYLIIHLFIRFVIWVEPKLKAK